MTKYARHPLNKHFEWDDKLAGPMWRLEQARLPPRVSLDDEDDDDMQEAAE